MPRPKKKSEVVESLENVDEDFTPQELREVIGVSKISKRTVKKYLTELETEGVVEVTRTIGRSKLYRIKGESLE